MRQRLLTLPVMVAIIVSLSRLWQQQGKRDEARELLAPIFGMFVVFPPSCIPIMTR